MARQRSEIHVNAQFALSGDRAASRQSLADFCATVSTHLRAYRPGKRLGPVGLDPTLAHHLALAFERILNGERPDKALGLAFERGRRQNRDTDRLAQRDGAIDAAFWYLAARGMSRAAALRECAEIVGLTERQMSRRVSGRTVSEAHFLATLAEGPREPRIARLAELAGRYRAPLEKLLHSRSARPRRFASAQRTRRSIKR